MATNLDYLSFLGIIVYLVINNLIDNKWTTLISGLLLLFPISKFIWDDTPIITIIFLCISALIGFSTIYPKFKNNKKDDDNKNATDYSLVMIMLFTLSGAIAFFVNKYEGETCSSSNAELLCNKTFIMIYILLSIGVYYFIKLLKKNGWILFNQESNDTSNDFFNIIILSVWQLYVYLLLDGFNLGSDKTSSMSSVSSNYYGGAGSNTMYKLFSYMSLVVLAGLFISNSIIFSEIESDKLNNIKELQYNLITTSVLTIILIFAVKND